MPIEPVSGVIATTGLCAQYAAVIAETTLAIPGPFCAMQACGRPVRPARSRHRRGEVGDSWAVLRDAGLRPAGDSSQSVRGMTGGLLVRDRDEADARRRKQVQGIHER